MSRLLRTSTVRSLLHRRPSSSPHFVVASQLLRHVHGTATRNTTIAVSDAFDASKPADFNPANFDATECRSPPSEKILQIVNDVADLTLMEASDLSYLLKKKLGLSDLAMPFYGGMGGGLSPAMAGSVAPEEEKKPEKTNFDIKLEKFDAAAKIKVIKEIRAFTTLGLKEAKEMVEKLPAILKQGVAKDEANEIIEKLKTVGATAVLE